MSRHREGLASYPVGAGLRAAHGRAWLTQPARTLGACDAGHASRAEHERHLDDPAVERARADLGGHERHGDGLARRAKDGEGDAVALGAVAEVRLVRRAAWRRGWRRGACARHDALRRQWDDPAGLQLAEGR